MEDFKVSSATKYDKNPSDWILKHWAKVLVPKHNYNELKHSYWQSAVSRNSCSIFWAITTVSNTFDVTFSLEEQKQIRAEAKEQWASDETGWWFSKAIRHVQQWCKQHKDIDFRYYTIKKEEFEKYAKKWFAIYWGIKILEGSTRDKLKDWVIWDDVESYGKMKLWHAISFTMIWDKFGYVDNYKNKSKVNTPTFTNLDELIKAWYFFNTGYIMMTNKVEEIIEALRNRPEAKKKLK